jgi:hypothetical protein
MSTKLKRPLTDEELSILGLIQRFYGSQNTLDDVFLSEADEAVIFVKDSAGTMGICVVLTNVARWSREEGLTADQICQKYLIPA